MQVFKNSFFIEHLRWLIQKFYNYFCFFASLCLRKIFPKAAVPICSTKLLLLQILQNSQEDNCAGTCAVFLFKFFPFIQNTSVRLPLKFAEYLFLKPFFLSLDKSILLHRRSLRSKFSRILETFSKLFPPDSWISLFCLHLVFADRKHFYSILTDLSNL